MYRYITKNYSRKYLWVTITGSRIILGKIVNAVINYFVIVISLIFIILPVAPVINVNNNGTIELQIQDIIKNESHVISISKWYFYVYKYRN